MVVNTFANRLSSDFTLFNLNDPKTTKFYIANMDYLINNFPYFNDIQIVSSYFLSRNKKFNSKFQTRITKFIEIVEYDSKLKDSEWCKMRTPEIVEGSSSSKEEVKELYPSSEDETEIVQLEKFTVEGFEDELSSNESGNNNNSVSVDNHNVFSSSDIKNNGNVQNTNNITDEESIEMVISKLSLEGQSLSDHKRPSSLINIKNIPHFPNHFPQGPEFIVNPTGLVMKFYSKILGSFIGKFVVTPQFISKLIKKIHYEEIGSLLCTLVKQSSALDTLVTSGCLKQICFSNLPVLEMILDSSLYQNVTEQSSEDRLLDQVYEQKDYLIRRFFLEGEKTGVLIKYLNENEFDHKTVESLDIKNESDNGNKSKSIVFPTIFNILLIICSNKSNVAIPEIELPFLNRFTLLYLRILSFNTSFSTQMISKLSNIYFENPNCSHSLFSTSRILLKTDPDMLARIEFFERMKESIFIYTSQYSVGNSVDSLLAFLIKAYSKFKSYLLKLSNSSNQYSLKQSWKAAHAFFDFFIKQEKFGYKIQDLKLSENAPSFERYVIDCFLSDLPYSTVFQMEHQPDLKKNNL
ncbi:uncharacterized protein VICG_00274 [Vittaforma corneae ATCC 50505]|uniref:Uncharacterized protein n=1 Tax=Vittaforma corneae (strain ATCC 50505) TaxID=993615 RepID=L2GQB9_VITCO|nr:uncharacterized protein VICG_00274 [Vittaforma corneae ATCC 50505]ELA42522.1 hypothetical protein VICG_00274 [Vittaforma corneae ATCC 50505]